MCDDYVTCSSCTNLWGCVWCPNRNGPDAGRCLDGSAFGQSSCDNSDWRWRQCTFQGWVLLLIIFGLVFLVLLTSIILICCCCACRRRRREREQKDYEKDRRKQEQMARTTSRERRYQELESESEAKKKSKSFREKYGGKGGANASDNNSDESAFERWKKRMGRTTEQTEVTPLSQSYVKETEQFHL